MKSFPGSDAKSKEKEVFELSQFISKNPSSSASDIATGAARIFESCRTTAYNHIEAAIENGWIVREGLTKGARYSATGQFRHREAILNLGQPLSKRPKVGYNADFLGDYKPNETYYLSQAQRDSLHTSCSIGSFNVSDKKLSQEVRRFMADITHNSSAFEGVNVKYADTISFLEENIESRHMSAFDALILRNHYNAIRFIVENTHCPVEVEDIVVSEYDARNIHALLSDGLLRDRRMQGQLRQGHVEIRESSYIPTDVPDTIKSEFATLIEKAKLINDPYEQAVFLLIHIPYLQPFEDCNKRTARLLCNIPLLSNGILPVSWSEVNQLNYTDATLCVYEKNSTYGLCEVFVDACKRSFERFDISMRNREPSRLEITHAKQISDAIRRRILQDDDSLSPDVKPNCVTEFTAIVEDILSSIRENEMVASPYLLRPNNVAAWLERERESLKVEDAPAPN